MDPLVPVVEGLAGEDLGVLESAEVEATERSFAKRWVRALAVTSGFGR